MMETYGTHPDLVKLLNGYDEIFVPTSWNKDVFAASGVTSPITTIPLGVNTLIYRPGERAPLPPCTLITTGKAGEKAVPDGFLFVNTSNPSFRKGIDVLVKAFEDAFSGNQNVSLVLCVSYSSLAHCDPFAMIKGGQASCRSKIYALDGKMGEYEMADMYRACDAYVTASRGEGWNLPLMEAAACGLPVVAPDAFSHKEFLTHGNAFLFSPDGSKVIQNAESISPWYKDQAFVNYESASIKRLSDLMQLTSEDRALSNVKAEKLRKTILEKYTWDVAAGHASKRLMEILRLYLGRASEPL
jgi:hypothetical protein